MAPQRQTGGNSYIFLGRQPKRGVHITGATVFQGIAPDWNDLENIVPALIPRQFPFIRNTLDPTAETTASESIVGATPQHKTLSPVEAQAANGNLKCSQKM